MIFYQRLFNFLTNRFQNDNKETCNIKRSRFYAYCCGIVGYLGDDTTNDILLHGIDAMKSRGYDSCGICTLEEGKLKVTKCCSVGTPADSYNILKSKVLATHSPSRLGIGHTRWATVGKPSDKNSHPHFDLSRTLALVHNGTISNIEELYHDYYKDLIKQRFKKHSLNDNNHDNQKYFSKLKTETTQKSVKLEESNTSNDSSLSNTTNSLSSKDKENKKNKNEQEKEDNNKNKNKENQNVNNKTNTTNEVNSDLFHNGEFHLPDSDSEAVAIFIGLEYENTGDLYTAFKSTIKRLKGTWALCMMSSDYPSSLFVAAHEGPLLFARSKTGIYVGSEPTVFTKYVDDCVALNDGDVFELTLENVDDYYRKSKLLKLEHQFIEETHEPYPNWFVKELSEQVYMGRIIISLLNPVLPVIVNESEKWNEQTNKEVTQLLTLREKYLGNDSLSIMGGDWKYENELLRRVDISSLGFTFPDLPNDVKLRLKRTKRLLFVACGTSLYAAKYVAKILQKLNYFEAIEVDDASDLTLYRYHNKDNTILHISNSGETMDCILASNYIKKRNPDCLNISLINTLHSSLERASDATIHLRIGREKSVPSTKAFSAQITVLLILGLYIVDNSLVRFDKRNEDDSTDYSSSVYKECTNDFDNDSTPNEGETELLVENEEKYVEHYGSSQNYSISSLYKSLTMFPSSIEKMLKDNPVYDKIVTKLLNEKIVYILGRGCGHIAALESSLKMKEVAYIQAEGVLSGAMKHGFYAMIIEKEQTPTISIITSEDKEMTINSTMQLKARGSFIIAITDIPEEIDFADLVIQLPKIGALTPALAVVPIQIISSKIAIQLGRNPDIPRGLAKTVTTL